MNGPLDNLTHINPEQMVTVDDVKKITLTQREFNLECECIKSNEDVMVGIKYPYMEFGPFRIVISKTYDTGEFDVLMEDMQYFNEYFITIQNNY